jgi:glycosyltransferase involved in cell wall biosynthesis
VPRHLLDASVFCMPTRIEPFGIAPLEAMARRLPVVATRVGALPDFVEENQSGFLVQDGDSHALADALSRLLDNPEMCRRFGQRGHEIFRSRYTWEAVSDRLRAEILPLIAL